MTTHATAENPTYPSQNPDPADRAFLGHPKGLGYLAFAEGWERFSYYGMQTLLVLYMTQQLFTPGHVEANAALLADLDGDDAMVVTRFGLAAEDEAPRFVDLVYPVAVLKPHTPQLTGKVVGKTAEPDPTWSGGLTRAAMGITFPVRSVLAEPTISLAQLMELKVGDVIPIAFGNDVPVMVGGDRFGTGTVGTLNGKAAIKLTKIRRIQHED